MITDGAMYISVLIFTAAVIVCLPKFIRGRGTEKFFSFAPPVVLIYLGLMALCTLGLWDLPATAGAYSSLKNPLLYAMLFIMLLRCDLRKILRLGPKMLIGFFAAAVSVGLGFVISFAVMRGILGVEAWKPLGALCGSWMGGGGNMLAVQAALNIDESMMAYALVMDSICGTLYVMFLLWAVGFPQKFNRWTRADTRALDSVGAALEQEARADSRKLAWQNIILLLGMGLLASALCTQLGSVIGGALTFFDKVTWTVLLITALGIILAMTPLGRIKGTEEISNVLLYIVIALIASRADLRAMGNAPAWLLAGFIILAVHVVIMVIMAKLFRLDIFTCAVASLANIGGTATAPVLAGAYSSALVPVGVIMALLGYIVGTGGGLLVAQLMSMLA